MIPFIFAFMLGAASLWRFYVGLHDLSEGGATREVPYYPPLKDPDTGVAPPPSSDQFFVDYFQDYPESTLRDKYPEQYQLAMAVLRYRALEVQRQEAMISEEDYQRELEVIAALIPLNKIC